MEGVCAVRQYLSSPAHEEGTRSAPLRVPIFSTLSDEDPCGHRVMCWFKCVPRSGTLAFHCTAGQTASRRYFNSNKLDGTIPDWLSKLKLLSRLCARPARMPRPVPLGVRAVRVVHVRTSRLGTLCGARVRRAVGTAGSVRPSGREGGSTACVLRGSRCGRMRQAAAGQPGSAACLCAAG